jgi:hypothetical protein
MLNAYGRVMLLFKILERCFASSYAGAFFQLTIGRMG